MHIYIYIICKYVLSEQEHVMSNLLPYFHGLLIVVAEEIIGLISSDSLSAIHAQVKHCKMNKRHEHSLEVTRWGGFCKQ